MQISAASAHCAPAVFSQWRDADGDRRQRTDCLQRGSQRGVEQRLGQDDSSAAGRSVRAGHRR